jgi:tetratricopeptide (TPR) repeat protein
MALLLALVTFLVSWPSLKSDFVYDAHKEIIDEGFITSFSNLPSVLSLKVLGMNLMLADRPGQLLYLMLIAAVSGKEPFAYHLCSNLLHAANVALLFLLLKRLSTAETTGLTKGDTWKILTATAAVTLIFALHPLSVESVAEVSYSSSLLVTVFTLLALLAATFFHPEKKQTALLAGSLGTLCAFAAVTAKESGIAVAILLVIYWFLYRRQESKGPWLWFLVAASTVSVFFLAIRFSCARPDQEHLSYLGGAFSQVFFIQPRLWVFMMGKLIWPMHLSADYTPVDQIGPPTSLALAILAVVIVLQSWLLRKSRLGALGVAIYWAGLATVSNFVPLYRPLADRFYYLPMVGVTLQLLALLLITLPSPRIFFGIMAPLCVALLPLTAFTLQREAVFADDFSLWSDTLQVNPLSAVAQSGLGWALYQKGQLDEAISHYQKAIEINPDMAEAYNNLGLALYQKGQWDDAIAQYQKAQDLNPDTAQIPNNIGLALAQKGRLDEAIVQYQKALAINPNFAETHNNLGMVLAQEGRLDDAVIQYRKVLEIVPDQAETHNNLAIVLAQQGQMTQAIAEFQMAVDLKPDYLTAQNNLAKAKESLSQPTVGK